MMTECDIVQIEEELSGIRFVQPCRLMLNRKIVYILDTFSALMADVQSKTLDETEQDLLVQYITRCTVRYA